MVLGPPKLVKAQVFKHTLGQASSPLCLYSTCGVVGQFP